MTLEQRYDAITKYLMARVIEKDWHGVSDAANDLRVLEAKEPSLIKREVAWPCI